MADPISSLAPNNAHDYSLDDTPEATASAAVPAHSSLAPSVPLACLPEAAESAAPPSGAESLVARFSPPPASPKPVVSYSALSTSAGAVPGGGSYRVAGTGLEVQVEIGALKGTSQLATAYVQYGDDKDAQVALARQTVALSGHGYGVAVTGQTGVLRANLGEHNDDGSIGGNIGSGVEAFGVEVTVETPVGSLTYGQGASLALGGSMGVRDRDHDGKPELCAKFSIPDYTVGACVEEFW
jgi:hypothetical protein